MLYSATLQLLVDNQNPNPIHKTDSDPNDSLSDLFVNNKHTPDIASNQPNITYSTKSNTNPSSHLLQGVESLHNTLLTSAIIPLPPISSSPTLPTPSNLVEVHLNLLYFFNSHITEAAKQADEALDRAVGALKT